MAAEGDDLLPESVDSFFDLEAETIKIYELIKKVEALEQEKITLLKQNDEVEEHVKKCTANQDVLGLQIENNDITTDLDLQNDALKLRMAMSEGSDAERKALDTELETKMIMLQKMEENVRKIDEVKTAVLGVVNGVVVERFVAMFDEGSNKETMNLQWVLGAVAIVVVVGGIVCLRFVRR